MNHSNHLISIILTSFYRVGIVYEEGITTKVGYLSNIKTTSFQDQNGGDLSAVLLYFIEPNGNWFKCLYQYEPYFYLQCAPEVVK